MVVALTEGASASVGRDEWPRVTSPWHRFHPNLACQLYLNITSSATVLTTFTTVAKL